MSKGFFGLFLEKLEFALDEYLKRLNLERKMSKKLRSSLLALIKKRLKNGTQYEYSEKDLKLIEKVLKFLEFPVNTDTFESRVLRMVKKWNQNFTIYGGEGDTEGRVKWKEIEENVEELFEGTNDIESRLEEIYNMKEWKKWGKIKNGMQMYKMNWEKSKFLAVKATRDFELEGVMYRDISRFIWQVGESSLELDERATYQDHDPDNIYTFEILKVDENNGFCHLRQTPHSFLVSDRDFVFTKKFIDNKEDKIACYFGVTCDNEDTKDFFPVDRKCVRGILNFFCWRCQELENGKLRFSYYMHVEPKGWIPALVYNFAIKNKGKSVGRFVSSMLKDPSLVLKFSRGIIPKKKKKGSSDEDESEDEGEEVSSEEDDEEEEEEGEEEEEESDEKKEEEEDDDDSDDEDEDEESDDDDDEDDESDE